MQQEYDNLSSLDFPKRNQLFPTDQELKDLPTSDYSLNMIKFKQFADWGTLTGMQLSFGNGATHSMFEVSSANNDMLRIVDVETNRQIRYVSMRIKWRYAYTGLRFYETQDQLILDQTWEDVGDWTPLQEIPVG